MNNSNADESRILQLVQAFSAQISEKEQAIQALSVRLEQQTRKVESLQKHFEVAAAAAIKASPNPIQVRDGSGLGETTISYTCPEGVAVEVRVGAPDGPLFTGSSASAMVKTGKWVIDETIFFLQDVADDKPLTREHTLDTVTVRVTSEEALRDQLAEKEAELKRITNSFGWRLLSVYGRIKYRYILPLLRFMRLLPSTIATDDGLRVHIDTYIPESLVIGKGNALYIAGWCYHSSQRIKQLHINISGVSHPVKTFRMGRHDVLANHFPRLDPNGYSYRSGFWTIVPLAEINKTTHTTLFVRATLANGENCSERIARITLEPSYQRAAEVQIDELTETQNQPLIAICMATHNPPLDLFARQIQSIRNQTYSNWICIISDDCSDSDARERIQDIVGQDRRFQIDVSPSRLGFYRNFERCIGRTPDNAEFVALSDQDDYWHSDKLQVLLSRFDDTTTLVYSDMNIVDVEGYRVSNTYWTRRPNNYNDLASLILVNSITGAASLFSSTLLSLILPFPEKIGDGYHDHWIACIARAMGEVKYVDRPLYDYVQHAGNTVGHYVPPEKSLWKEVKNFLKYVSNARLRIRNDLNSWQKTYFNQGLRVKLLSRILALRCDPYIKKSVRQTIRRLMRIDESFLTTTWLAVRALSNVGRVSNTVGSENRILGALCWRRFWSLKSFLKTGTFIYGSSSERVLQTELSQEHATSPDEPDGDPQILESSPVEFIRQKIAPLSMKRVTTAPRRVNLLIPTIDLKYVFAGYITKFNLALQLARAELNVRLIIVDHCEYNPTLWKEQLHSFQGLDGMFEWVEIAYAFDRTTAVEVSDSDVFIATTWWTAHIAHEAAKALGKGKFLYLIQEYEPFTFPMGTFACLARESYTFPHYAIFSTELLRDYFRKNSLSVFEREDGDSNSTSFQNAITSVGQVTMQDIANRHPKKFLLYARPEDHAARNMFEMGVLALSEAIESGVFNGEWEFRGIGTVGKSKRVKLSNGAFLELLPRQSQESYRQILRDHDLGFSLMYTPHPSLVPIEMASAGMLVVTNSYANKTAHKMAEISRNILAVEPTVECLKLGLKSAAENIEDFDRRIRGSNVQWSNSWDVSFDHKVIARIKEFIESARSSRI